MTGGFGPVVVTAAIGPRYPLTGAGLTEALTALGNSHNRVADTLLAGDFRGQVCCETTCPLAAYLTACFPAARSVVTGTDAMLLNATSGVLLAQVRLPAPVAAFIDRFDMRDEYRDLASGDGAQ